VATIIIIVGIAIPQYRSVSLKAKIVANMGFIQSLQNDYINVWNLINERPIRLKQLSINPSDFVNLNANSVIARHKSSGCDVRLGPGVYMICPDQGYTLFYRVIDNNNMPRIGEKRLQLNGGDRELLEKVALNLGFQPTTNGWIIP
jgi:hypothetical protein